MSKIIGRTILIGIGIVTRLLVSLFYDSRGVLDAVHCASNVDPKHIDVRANDAYRCVIKRAVKDTRNKVAVHIVPRD